jgi:hypothetical protein
MALIVLPTEVVVPGATSTGVIITIAVVRLARAVSPYLFAYLGERARLQTAARLTPALRNARVEVRRGAIVITPAANWAAAAELSGGEVLADGAGVDESVVVEHDPARGDDDGAPAGQADAFAGGVVRELGPSARGLLGDDRTAGPRCHPEAVTSA